MARLWVKMIAKHRIVQQSTLPCAWGEEESVLREICHELDIPAPLWLNKHRMEYDSFRRTIFLPEHFMEDIHFDKLEIEFLEDTNVKRKSNDPRNQFDGF